MTDKVDVKLIGAWNAYQKATDPAKLEARIKASLATAGDRIGRQFVAKAQKAIRNKDYAPNSPITVILKRGQSTPLVGRPGGDLFQAISYDASNPFRILLGVLRQKAGEELVNIAIVLHEGATIDVGQHPQIRMKVFAMLREAMGRKAGSKAARMSRAAAIEGMSKAVGGPKNVWTIPPRRFLSAPLQDPSFRTFAAKTWSSAIRVAIFGSSKPKGHVGPKD